MLIAYYIINISTFSSFFLSTIAISVTGSLRLGYKFPRFHLKNLMANYAFFRHIIFVILMISRKYATLSPAFMTDMAIFSAVMLFFFHFTRLMFVVGAFGTRSIFLYFFVFLVYMIGFSNAIFRLSIILGNAIDSDSSNHIVYTLDNVPNMFAANAAQVTQHGTQTPLPNPAGASKLGRLGIVAGILMVPFAMYTCYELRLTRKLTEISAQASADSAKALQQKTDIKAVKNGLLSIEAYHAKYSNRTYSDLKNNQTLQKPPI